MLITLKWNLKRVNMKRTGDFMKYQNRMIMQKNITLTWFINPMLKLLATNTQVKNLINKGGCHVNF
jgi:hypothetical protein